MNVRPMGLIRANKANKAHIHKQIIQECGGHNIPYVTAPNLVLLYDPSVPVDSLVASVEVLKNMIKLRSERKKNEG